MKIEIEGSRASDNAWRQAYSIPVERLHELTVGEIAWTTPDDPVAAQVARKLSAIHLTEKELVAKCEKLGQLASDWLGRVNLSGEVTLVRLRCVRGLFDLHIVAEGKLHEIEVDEDVLDALLQSGSLEAQDSLLRLFSANMGRFLMLKAS
jgi:hypothetical protein